MAPKKKEATGDLMISTAEYKKTRDSVSTTILIMFLPLLRRACPEFIVSRTCAKLVPRAHYRASTQTVRNFCFVPR
ncbi:NHP6B Chromatin-associated protein containing the HMG domain protein [Pyrenophora tritici-repentis]|nr:NHP6B Chromatin-associated protein containing the HMG domain protein [Pyrenophora tritici-repentis]